MRYFCGWKFHTSLIAAFALRSHSTTLRTITYLSINPHKTDAFGPAFYGTRRAHSEHRLVPAEQTGAAFG